MASVATIEPPKTSSLVEAPPFSLIEPKGLATRLAEELTRAASEFASNPGGFIRSLVAADVKDTKRRRLIYSGLAFALVAHVVFVAIAAIAGWHRIMEPPKEDRPQITMLNPTQLVEPPEGASEKPAGKKDGGGGGGGQENPLPASKGHLPQTIPQSAVVDMRPSEIPNPVLAVAPTIQGLESPPPPGQIGDPNGKPSEFSGGPGAGGGIGNNKGSGVGNGDGPGAGPGKKGGKGGDRAGYPDATGIAEVNFSDLASFPDYTPFKWLRRPNPVVTPAAQENKVIGIVLLRATFHADGTVSDIEVVMPVEDMTESAVDSLMRSKFRPATVNGKPVTVRKVLVKITVHY